MNEKINPIKSLGQNFLIDRNIVQKIIAEINPQPEDSVLEIGPGTGAITFELAEKTKRFFAVEIDRRAIEILRRKIPGIKIIHADFLKFDIRSIASENEAFKVAGNIPYNITSPIIFKLIENRRHVKNAVLMMQHEVAKRLNGKMNTKDYGILSVVLSFFADVKLCFKISPNVFFPKPRVHSALIRIDFRRNHANDIDDRIFIDTVKACFGNRRKTLKNSLSNSIFGSYNFEPVNIDLNKRAEQLSLEEFLLLAKFIQRMKSQ